MFLKYFTAQSAWAWFLVLAWMGLIWFLSDQPDLSSGLESDFMLRKLAHITVFAVLTGLLYRALKISHSIPRALGFAAGIALLYAGIDEWHQTWVPGRHGNPVDIGIDALGIVASIGMTLSRQYYTRRGFDS